MRETVHLCVGEPGGEGGAGRRRHHGAEHLAPVVGDAGGGSEGGHPPLGAAPAHQLLQPPDAALPGQAHLEVVEGDQGGEAIEWEQE
jgi:hypothetical protein